MNNLTIILASFLLSLAHAASLPTLDSYNVVWNSPSNNVNGTMPLGNGDIGANVWVQDGDLLFLIGKTDAWEENSINCKLARVRVKISPNPFAVGSPFRQELRLQKGEMIVSGGGPGSEVIMRLWVDANQPVIRIQTQSSKPVSQQVILETWRNERTTLTNTQVSDMFKNLYGPDPYPTLLFPDTIVQGEKDRLLWYHHNIKPENDPYEINLTLQGMADYMKVIPHPLLSRTFGASIQGPGFTAADAKTLNATKARKSHLFSVYPLTTLHPTTADQWKAKLDEMIAKVDANPLPEAYDAHLAWWKAFWNRSEIHLAETNPANIPADGLSPAFTISRAYALCRFMNAAGGRGAQPIKYNGSIFTVGTPENPDFRQWGGAGFWFQNQRLVYWPMLAAGDFDLMKPWFRMYREALPFAKRRCQKYFNHDGANFGETVTFWGAEASGHYGWTRPFEKRDKPLCECPFLTYYWQNNIENLRMMLDYFEHTGDMDFARHTLMPHADEVTKFSDFHYKRDENGKIRFDPAASLETWHSAVNPLPEIAGLRTQLPRLLALRPELTSDTQRQRFQRMIGELPPIPTGSKEGLPVILPAEIYSQEANYETPELYGVFPYQVYGVGKPELELARNTYVTRKHKKAQCWYQDQVQSALLGLVEETRQGVINRASAASHSSSRFPAFWNAFHDWVPDIDHGGNLQLALQLMLLQAEAGDNGKLHLFPAWPVDWDVDFKLHAPGQTLVEGSLRGGELKSFKVTPEFRAAHVVNWLGKMPGYHTTTMVSGLKPINASSTWPDAGYDAQKANDNDLMTRWAATGDTREGHLMIDLGQEMRISRVWIAEIEYAHVREFTIEVMQDSDWKAVARGTTIGRDKVLDFPVTTARRVRLNIIKADGPININEFRVFRTP